ncbi:hypothetical protein IWW36_002616 [Coemansia brasiliensis]|uniref:RRM domain-containing protein n=1 Tax=Coemansia brasiliensis TaxID=2650707 RepID=A0A9W8ID50_9FUNG|nr:hypothetical protein IWW36_002616 [Coemansia brasiliensis]
MLHVKNLPMSATEESVRSVFENYGKVHQVRMLPAVENAVFRVAFVQFYVGGEIPETYEEQAKLPDPTHEEIEQCTECRRNVMNELDGYKLDGRRLEIKPANNDKPDKIQFHARVNLQRKKTPRPLSESDRQAKNEMASYERGYKDGFRDGLLEAKKTQ